MGIFSERDRMAQEAARNSPDKRDELIEDMLDALCDSHDHLIAYSPVPASDALIISIRALIAMAHVEGYGQAGGEK